MEEAKTAIRALTEVSEEKKKLVGTMAARGAIASSTGKLFREGNKSRLVKVSVALIALPEPTPVSPIVGSRLVAAGAVQKGIQNRAAFAEDVGKDFKKALRDIGLTKDLV